MEIVILLVILFISMVVHEYAHAWMALKCGDPTAKEMGRLTLNPIKHIDPFGTILLPAILVVLRMMGSPFFPVALAKPVPVNFMRLRNPRVDMMWVALAGPGINVIIAVILSFFLEGSLSLGVFQILILTIYINLLLAIFNLIPIPPLDGSRVLLGLLPKKIAMTYSRIEPYGIIIIFALLPFGLFNKIVLPITSYVASLLGVQLP